MSKFLSAENQYFVNLTLEKIGLFSSLNALIFPSPEPQTTDFQLEINFRHALIRNYPPINLSKTLEKEKI